MPTNVPEQTRPLALKVWFPVSPPLPSPVRVPVMTIMGRGPGVPAEHYVDVAELEIKIMVPLTPNP